MSCVSHLHEVLGHLLLVRVKVVCMDVDDSLHKSVCQLLYSCRLSWHPEKKLSVSSCLCALTSTSLLVPGLKALWGLGVSS